MKKFTKDQAGICFGKNSDEILNKLKSRRFRTSTLSTYLSTLYTTLPHNLIKEKPTDLIEISFQRECSSHLIYNDKNAVFTSDDHMVLSKRF